MTVSYPWEMGNRVCIVTGANSGIGKACAHALAAMGATVVFACRSMERAERAREELARETGNDDLAVMPLDLATLATVRAFARAFKEKYDRLDVLVNNAGIYTSRRSTTRDGFELTWETDYVSHFLLTHLLLDSLKRSTPSRVINVTSEAHQIGTIRFDDLNAERRWGGLAAYGQAKLAQVLFTRELARRLQGTGVVVNCMHPGGVRTGFAKGAGIMRLGVLLAWPFMLSPEEGADTIVWLAAAPEAASVSGQYFIKRKPAEPHGVARDVDLARRLWEVSETLSGLRTADPVANPS